MPSVKVSRLPRIDSRPRCKVKVPTACGDEAGPVSLSEPPSSASTPLPWMKIWFGALTVTSSLRPLPPPLLAVAGRSALSCARTAGGAFLCLTSSAASEPGSLSGTVMTVLARLTVPDNTGAEVSGPLMVRSPPRLAVTTRPSV